MYKIDINNLENFFDAVRNKYPLVVMQGENVTSTRSVKDYFFPKTENIAKFKFADKKIEVTENIPSDKPFVFFGARACDIASLKVLDEVYINMEPVDSYYKAKRENAVIITKACKPCEILKTCFCASSSTATTQTGLTACEPEGDIISFETEGFIFFDAKTDKGKNLISEISSNAELSEATEDDIVKIESFKKSINEKLEKQELKNFDTEVFRDKDMLKVFNSENWDKLSSTCLGCGSCTYVCPTCMCFDIRDFKAGDEVQRYRCWDSCMFSDFTQMAADNPRKTQKERFRQRFMHKMTYYPLAHKDITSCVGCGRCLVSCPINMNIVKVALEFNKSKTE